MEDGKERITPENWLDVDTPSAMWLVVDRETGEFRQTTPEDWVAWAPAYQLSPNAQ